MKVTFLGTGTSQGVPLISCECEVCISSNKKDNRLRSSVSIDIDGLHLVIDSGPDSRYQMLRKSAKNLDAILFTHGHKDHIAGLDDIRAFNYFQQRAIDIYATEETQQALRREYAYIFENPNYPGIPQVNVHTIYADRPFNIQGVEIIPIRVLHYRLEVLGFRIKDFTYITDANYIAPEEMEKVKGSKAVVLNALRHQEHVSHYNLEEAIEVCRELGAENSYFTHISHQLGLHDEISKNLPTGMHLAYDGLELNF